MIIAVAMTGMTMIEGMTIGTIVATMTATTVVIAIVTTGTTDTVSVFRKRGRGWSASRLATSLIVAVVLRCCVFFHGVRVGTSV